MRNLGLVLLLCTSFGLAGFGQCGPDPDGSNCASCKGHEYCLDGQCLSGEGLACELSGTVVGDPGGNPAYPGCPGTDLVCTAEACLACVGCPCFGTCERPRFACGNATCRLADQYCLSVTPGMCQVDPVTGECHADPSYSCEDLPAACLSAPNCACLAANDLNVGEENWCSRHDDGSLFVSIAMP